MCSLLESIAFRQPRRAQVEVSAVTAGLPAEVQRQVEVLLVSSADPDGAVHYLASLKQKAPDNFQRLVRLPPGLQNLITVFSNSHFLSDEILQNPQWLEQLGDLSRALPEEEYKERLEGFLAAQPTRTPVALSLALFRRQQVLRILIRDVQGFCGLSETTEELSNLADAILDFSYLHIRVELVARHGVPRYADENGQPRECGMSVMSLGN